MVRAGDWVLEQMSIYIFSIGPAVHVYIGVCVCVSVCVSVCVCVNKWKKKK